MPRPIRYEQAVYGSFPFWDRGYAVLARSPGCRPEWLAELRSVCQRYGERPAGATGAGGLFALRMACGPWAIVGPSSPGRDDQGRPDALAFHALFVGGRDYRKAGADPFAFGGLMRSGWTAETRELPSGVWIATDFDPKPPPPDERVARIVAALERGGRVAIESDGPRDDLARGVWRALPARVRERSSVASWAFGNGNRFDFVVLPKIKPGEIDSSYIDIDAPVPVGSGPSRRPSLAYLGIGAVLVGVLIGLVVRGGGTDPAATPAPAKLDRGPPEVSGYPHSPADPDERKRVAETLVDMAERFGAIGPEGPPDATDPAALMALLSDRLRYRGPWLSPAELAGLASDRGAGTKRDRALALEWEARVRRFADDRPLPPDFERGPLRWQLDALAWSFHLDGDPAASRRSAAEVPLVVADWLAVDVSLRSTPLIQQHPALAAYREFLGKLPRR